MNKDGAALPYEWDNGCGESLSDAAWDVIDKAVWQLEEAWRHAQQPNISLFVPPWGNPLRQRVLVELIKVDQECRWKSGIPTRTEDYLRAWPELSSRANVIAELLESECLTRAMLNAMPTCDELLARFSILSKPIGQWRIEVEAKHGSQTTPPTP